MIVKYNLEPGRSLTEAEKAKTKAEVNAAARLPIQYDEDCPELSENMLKSLKSAARNRNRALRLIRAKNLE